MASSSTPSSRRCTTITGSGVLGVLAVRRYGGISGPPVLALHGVTTTGAALEALFRAPLRRSVLACDLRGHGDSPWNPPWTLDQHVTDLLGAVDAVGGSAALIGHSFGGLIALHAGAARPDAIKALVLIDPALEVDQKVAAASALATRALSRWPTPAEARRAYRALLDTDTVVEGLAWLDESLIVMADGSVRMPFSPRAVDTAWREMTKPMPALDFLVAPVLLVPAERESLVSGRAIELLTAHLGSRLDVATIAAGHDLVWARHAEVRSLVVDFLHL